jgi:pilus assembly protein CpaC
VSNPAIPATGPRGPLGPYGGQPPDVMAQPFGDAFAIFFSSYSPFPFSAMLGLLESNGLGKVLAEPTLVTMSGQEAKFLAGGEFPIPIASALGQVNVEWKKFGVVLAFTPTVIASDTIHLKMSAEVSDIDPGASITLSGNIIPGLTSRQSETTVRLADGQSFAVAGLISDRTRSTIDKVPLLGDIPILGALFRSVMYQREETELLVVITARLVKPLAPHEVPSLPMPGAERSPDDFDLFFLGLDEVDLQPDTSVPQEPRAEGRGPSGAVGFIR